MKGQDKPGSPCHSGRETAATKLCKVFFFVFFFSFFLFPFLFLSVPSLFSFFLLSFFRSLSFFLLVCFCFKVRKETNRRQEADLQGFGVMLKGL